LYMNKYEENALYGIVGSNIKRFRQEKKMNQLSLSCKINLSRTSLVNIEQGKQHPSLLLLSKIADSLDVTLHDLIPKSVESINRTEVAINTKKNTKEEKVLDFLNSRVYLKNQ
jgi:DNA-binding XRE family transcriptional regulator